VANVRRPKKIADKQKETIAELERQKEIDQRKLVKYKIIVGT
jgi:hypothetical protein